MSEKPPGTERVLDAAAVFGDIENEVRMLGDDDPVIGILIGTLFADGKRRWAAAVDQLQVLLTEES